MFKMLILRRISWFFGLFNPFLRIYVIHNALFLPLRIYTSGKKAAGYSQG